MNSIVSPIQIFCISKFKSVTKRKDAGYQLIHALSFVDFVVHVVNKICQV